MRRIMAGVVVLLLAWPALADDDKPKDKTKEKAKDTKSVPAVLIQPGGRSPLAKPGTPAAEYQALVKEYSKAQQAFFKEYQEAKDEDKPKILQDKYYKSAEEFGLKFLGLAEKNPKDPVAVDALVWVVNNNQNSRSAAKNKPRAKAMGLLMRDYVTSEKIGSICQSLGYQIYDAHTEPMLRAILDKNPNSGVQAEACLALAQGLRQQSELRRMLASNPEQVKTYEQTLGKEYLETVLKKDAAKIEAESDELTQRFTDKYAADMKPEGLASMLQRLSYSIEKSSEKLARTLLEKDKRREVQGVACLTLAQILKRQADMPTLPRGAKQPGEQGEKLRKESEALLERAIEKYADVHMQFYGTVGKKAKSELHALRFLAIGKPAPEVEGVDQDGQKFKLSDYKGKVVLLDFWSQF